MIGFDEALDRIVAAATPLESVTMPLADAAGLFLASSVRSRIDAPPHDCAAMDGYAIGKAEGARFRVVGTYYPGGKVAGTLGPDECVRVYTGAPVPPCTDRVVVQELATAVGSMVEVGGSSGGSRHIRARASDFAAGDTVLPAGKKLGPQALIVAAGADRDRLRVWRPPRIAVLCTGDELVAPGRAYAVPGAIPESISLGIAALASGYGGRCVTRERLRDDLSGQIAAAERALEAADVVVIVGGASVGERDYAKQALLACGLTLDFSKVAIKPGKPVWFGRSNGKPVLGLPGNPAAAIITSRLFLAPLVRGLAGGDARDAVRWRQAPLARELPAVEDRETILRARWRDGAIEPLLRQNASGQHSLADAEVLLRRAAGSPAQVAGTMVPTIEF